MTKPESPKVAVIMGSQSDWPAMKDTPLRHTRRARRRPIKPRIVSAHRTPDRLVTYAKKARRPKACR
jgi:5-(carboxyamino)imidazole ribonucleotide mutase